MSPIVEFRSRSPDVVLAETLQENPTIRLTIVTEVATDPDRPYVSFWARGGDLDAFEAAMAEDATVASVERMASVDDRGLFRIQVSDDTGIVSYPAWVEAGITPLDARWADGWWHVRLRVPDRETLGDVREWCEAAGVDFRLECVYEHDGPSTGDASLTEEQRQVLRTAADLGYFEIPRAASMADVADALDISSQAVSERLRRGYRHLVDQHVS
jgi:predicted DNA binding protein